MNGKRIKQAYADINRDKFYAVGEAVKLIKARATAKFDETIEVAINLNIDATQTDQTVRGVIAMPNGTGKKVRVAVFAKGDKAKEATDAGADLVGADELATAIQGGQIDFDRCIATPDMMGLVGRLGKVLGPRGLMPNPKLGTVTPNVADAVRAVKGGQVQYKIEKAGIVHAGIGKASFTEKAIEENLRALVTAVQRARPSGIKGAFIKKLSLSSTMGPGVKLDLTGLGADSG